MNPSGTCFGFVGQDYSPRACRCVLAALMSAFAPLADIALCEAPAMIGGMWRLLEIGKVAVAVTVSLMVLIDPARAAQAARTPLPETSGSSVGYETVAAALADLRTRPGVVFTTENGWLIATQEAAYAIWSFAPKGYPAYPAVVKRQVTPNGSGSSIEMAVLCEASKTACDELVSTFARMNGLPLPK